ncbi:DeoR/GlpR transcriptional regulator [Paenibacillus sp. Marseille-P2973]|uniref:DeoR/GlpR family DNA-binding transcription regulator n=1 Tax=Paenibacillus sp. Marseille-P2973 TaxID=1871032 RepID=UPI001B374B65|nr:DeoR/GlpR family DNA-binding transcription regulator [Paenibacillus sp. Marseille-P2973]MBQ4897645.1 DeoR/GlpR transcriptional regulator [Paenibacillus sp. Marseille-P2973]
MSSIRRYEKIMEVLLTNKEVTVAELSDRLGVTGKTIREDLTRLEEQGLIIRVHGGAVLAQGDQFGILPAKEPLVKHAEEKADIARKALAHIQEGDIIALDGGSTTLEIARRLDNRPMTVITNDVYIISELAAKDHIRLVVPGGYRVRNMLAGPEATAYVKQLNIQKAFISATGIHPEHGLSIYTGDLIEFKRALIDTAREVIAVINHHKFGQTALRTFASLNEITRIITDGALPAEIGRTYSDAGIIVE